MSTTFSDHWYRVEHLHPRLRSHVELDRHCYRGEIWHVLKDTLGTRQHRLNEQGWRIVARMDGRLSLQQIWELAVAEGGDDAPTQPETIALLAQLHEAELIQSESAPDVGALFENAGRRRQQERRQRLNPMSLRVSLFDPSRLVDLIAPLAAPLFKRWVLAAWLALVALALVMLAPRGGEFASWSGLHLGTPRLLLTLWLVYPLVKAVHELAHAVAVRVWGGEVHEFGISLLLLMPVPYVDASAAAGFRERHRRVMVSLIGVIAETALAAMATIVWLSVGDGVVRDIAFATMLIGGVSTLLFNGNPLMRFDAYHALADAIDSPGLGRRGDALWLSLAQQHLFGVRQPRRPAVAPGERPWLLGYAAASFIYRAIVSVAIVGWLVHVNVWLGAVAAGWLLFGMIGRPAWRLWRWVSTAPELTDARPRARLIGAVAVAAPLLVLFVMPLPDSTRAEGVVWAPEQAQLRSRGDGFVDRVAVADGDLVAAGDLIAQLRDPVLETEFVRIEARLRGLDAAYHAAIFSAPAQAAAVAQELQRTKAELARLESRRDALSLKSGVAGRVALAHPQDLAGVFVARGTLLGYVLPPGPTSLRVLVGEADIARVQSGDGAIAVRLADGGPSALAATLSRQTPAAARELPSAALGDRAGGPFLTDPSDSSGLRTLEPLYTLDLQLPERATDRIGARATVRFDHGTRPLALQWLRGLQQLFNVK